jgi:hypothetical protein
MAATSLIPSFQMSAVLLPFRRVTSAGLHKPWSVASVTRSPLQVQHRAHCIVVSAMSALFRLFACVANCVAHFLAPMKIKFMQFNNLYEPIAFPVQWVLAVCQ